MSLSPIDQQRVTQWIRWNGNGSLLDIGGGSGAVSRLLANQPNSHCVCIDISSQMLKHAELPCVQTDALNLPFKNDVFDIVIAAAFFHHIPRRESELLAEIFRVLRPGGRLIGYDPNATCLQNRLFMMATPFRLRIFSPDERPILPASLKEKALKAGFANFSYHLFSFQYQKITPFEAIQRYLLNPVAVGPLEPLFQRWFFWQTVKN